MARYLIRKLRARFAQRFGFTQFPRPGGRSRSRAGRHGISGLPLTAQVPLLETHFAIALIQSCFPWQVDLFRVSPDMTIPPNCLAAAITPPGRGAVSVVTVRGVLAAQKVDQWFQSPGGRSLSNLGDGSISFGYWRTATGPAETGPAEEVVVTKISHEHVEICGHGGNVAPRCILDDLRQSGCQETDWQSYLNSTVEHPFYAEAQLCLARCPTRRTAELVLAQLNGALAKVVSEIIDTLRTGSCDAAKIQLDSLTEQSRVGKHLTDPWRVVVAGPPNVGKSSLINALAGFDRSIVYAQPGTTRDVLIANVIFEGWPFELFDTAGLRTVDDPLESAGIELARDEMSRADLILMVDEVGADGSFNHQSWTCATAPIIHVRNKSDLLRETAPDSKQTWFTSATTGVGLKELIGVIVHYLIPNPIHPSAALLFAERQFTLARQASQASIAGRADEACQLLASITPLA